MRTTLTKGWRKWWSFAPFISLKHFLTEYRLFQVHTSGWTIYLVEGLTRLDCIKFRKSTEAIWNFRRKQRMMSDILSVFIRMNYYFVGKLETLKRRELYEEKLTKLWCFTEHTESIHSMPLEHTVSHETKKISLCFL